ncbi:MAG: UDP-N-acetylmuramoyl-tripeptide--D-alanyl-D-alanine ligase [Chitinophagales bacterium]
MQQIRIEELYELYVNSTGVTTDTRSINEGCIFFALKGEKFDANQFADEALTKGAGYAVVDGVMPEAWIQKWGSRLVHVKNVLLTLQRLAGYHRHQLECPVLAITGSNGKTTTKELVAAVMAKKFQTYATRGNLNNHIGIPLTLLSIKNDVEFAVIEMGANHQGEIASYCEYVNADFGLITNIGSAHLEGFGGPEGVVKGKTELYDDLMDRGGKVFVNRDSDLLWQKILFFGFSPDDVITYGASENVFCKGEPVSGNEFLTLHTQDLTIRTNLVGEYNFENVLSAVCVGKYFGVHLDDIKEAIENYVPSNNRSQKVSHGGATIVLDAYNANPSSMAEALKNFEKQAGNNKVVILGEMMELGDYSRAEHENILQQLSGMTLTRKVLTGDGFAFAKQQPGITWFATTAEVKEWFQAQQWDNALVLIKGSRKNELEKMLK